jgi:hypothetical protein
MFNKFDEQISLLAEETARKTTRRGAVAKILKGVTATVAALTLGTVAGNEVFATTCICDYPREVICSGCGPNSCPSGYNVCTTSSGCGPCVYDTGRWVSCSYGCYFKICWDCIPVGGNCNQTCGCLSDWLLSNDPPCQNRPPKM